MSSPIAKLPIGTMLERVSAGVFLYVGNPVRGKDFDLHLAQFYPHEDGVLVEIRTQKNPVEAEYWLNGNKKVAPESLPELAQVFEQQVTPSGIVTILNFEIPLEVSYTVAYEHPWGAMLVNERTSEIWILVTDPVNILCAK